MLVGTLFRYCKLYLGHNCNLPLHAFKLGLNDYEGCRFPECCDNKCDAYNPLLCSRIHKYNNCLIFDRLSTSLFLTLVSCIQKIQSLL